jgi:actin
MDWENSTKIVIDPGSGVTKAGFSGDDAPRAVFPTIVSDHKRGFGDCYYVGDEARDRGQTREPINRSVVNNWDDMEQIFYHTFYYELKTVPEENPVFVAISPQSSNADKEKMTEILFEKFPTHFAFLENQAKLALIGIGKNTGVVLDSGHGTTHAVPIHEGKVIHDAIQRIELGGKDLSEQFMKHLGERGISFRTTLGKDFVLKDIKNDLVYVSLDSEKETAEAKSFESYFEKKHVTLESERFRVPEIMFQPASLLQLNMNGVHRLVYDAVFQSEENIRNDLLKSIVLSGGNTMYTGFSERLQKELAALCDSSSCVKVIAPKERKYLCWAGGSILASTMNSEDAWMTKEAYEEQGASIVHQKSG